MMQDKTHNQAELDLQTRAAECLRLLEQLRKTAYSYSEGTRMMKVMTVHDLSVKDSLES
jgi:hypothetical protein